MRHLLVATAAAAALLMAGPSWAQTAPAPNQDQLFGSVRGFVSFDSTAMSSSKTFKALVNTAQFNGVGFGAAVDVVHDVFVRVGVSLASKNGSRAFVLNGAAVSLGVPLKIGVRALDVSGGWRYHVGSSLAIYGGAGLLQTHYTETSSFGSADDNVSTSCSGATVFAGLEDALQPWILAGFEVQYRRVPNALGASQVSSAFNESSLGGTSFRVMVSVRK